MASERRLTDLFIVGKEVTFDDGNGEPLTVYVRKLNASEHDQALRKANGARARVMIAKNDSTSEQHQDQRLMLADFSIDDLIEYLGEDEKQRKSDAIEAELADEEEWAKDEYLVGLRTAWEDGLKDTFAKEPDDDEAKRVFLELKRFGDAAEAAVAAHVEDFSRDLASLDEEALREKTFGKLMDVQGSLAWLGEFRMCEIWLSTRELDKQTFYFPARNEVDHLPNPVRDGLAAAYREISVAPLEGK